MRVENFINLSVVAGFFIGLIFGLVTFDDPEYVLFLNIVVTISMYLISLTMSAIYIYVVQPKKSMLSDKQLIEKQLDYFDTEFDQVEKQARALKRFIQNLDFSDELKVNSKKVANED